MDTNTVASLDRYFTDLEFFEHFITEAPEDEIIQNADYLQKRIQLNMCKLHSLPDKKLILRYSDILDKLSFILSHPHCSKKKIIFTCDKRKGGLADKLRGIVAVYKLSKELAIDFKIHWIYPVNLNNFLLPNSYDWVISDDEVFTEPLLVKKYTIFSSRAINKTQTQMKEELSSFLKDYKQIHIYTNHHFELSQGYGELFSELFKPSDALRFLIDHHLSRIGSGYISATFRFQQLLGDFKEGEFPILPENERKPLIKKCIKLLLKIHDDNPDKKILVTSDSMTFLEIANDYDFVYIITGKIAHIGYDHGHSVEVYMKSFLDYFLLTHSQCVYSIVVDNMYCSGFPRLAALHHQTNFVVLRE